MREVLDYLDDILESVEKIRRFTQGMSYDEFTNDPKTVDAVLRNFEVRNCETSYSTRSGRYRM